VKIFPHVLRVSRALRFDAERERVERHCIGISRIVAGDAVGLIALLAISASRGRGFRAAWFSAP